MTAVQIFRRENRLAKLIRKPGGISRKIAMAQAASNLGEIRDELILELDRILALIDRSATAEAANDNKAQAIIYHGSNHIIGLAEPCGIPELGKAAFSLCELVDRMTEAGAWNAVAVQVHLEAFKLLRGALTGRFRPSAEASRAVRRQTRHRAVSRHGWSPCAGR